MSDEENTVVADTIYGEARGEYGLKTGGMASLIAVGNVIMNRLLKPVRFGRTVAEICKMKWQFSCWNEGDPNYQMIMHPARQTDLIWQLCYQVATNITVARWPDLTQGSNHYHSTTIEMPLWAKSAVCKMHIGRHQFYYL